MKPLRVHPEHGLNPTMVVCFYCQKENGTIALLGAAMKERAPKAMVLDDRPCEQCAATMAEGITFIEACETGDEKRLPVAPNRHLTGRWMVIKERALEAVITNDELREQVRKIRRVMVEPEAYDRIMLVMSPAEGNG